MKIVGVETPGRVHVVDRATGQCSSEHAVGRAPWSRALRSGAR